MRFFPNPRSKQLSPFPCDELSLLADLHGGLCYCLLHALQSYTLRHRSKYSRIQYSPLRIRSKQPNLQSIVPLFSRYRRNTSRLVSSSTFGVCLYITFSSSTFESFHAGFGYRVIGLQYVNPYQILIFSISYYLHPSRGHTLCLLQ